MLSYYYPDMFLSEEKGEIRQLKTTIKNYRDLSVVGLTSKDILAIINIVDRLPYRFEDLPKYSYFSNIITDLKKVVSGKMPTRAVSEHNFRAFMSDVLTLIDDTLCTKEDLNFLISKIDIIINRDFYNISEQDAKRLISILHKYNFTVTSYRSTLRQAIPQNNVFDFNTGP
jgi:hypothetical protein